VSDPRPIGMFDSGVGGLTVARAVLDLLPHEPLLYVGDTARSPYGPRQPEEIRRYALEIADYLVHRDVKMLVVACNSVEVSAIGEIADRAHIPVVGVVEPGTRAAARQTRNRIVGMIGTQATVRSGLYDRAMAATDARITLHSNACPVFVEHVERGDTTSPELREAARGYLSPLMAADIDTLILAARTTPCSPGCSSASLDPAWCWSPRPKRPPRTCTPRCSTATFSGARRRRRGTSSSPRAIPRPSNRSRGSSSDLN
jgi:glutamate racemase